MADSRQLRRLIAYNQWADEQVLAAVTALDPAELARPREAYFGAIDDNLRHVNWAHRIWLSRWRDEAPPPRDAFGPPWPAAYGESHVLLGRFVDGLSDADADRIFRFRDSRGTPHEMVLSEAIVHVVNHGTAHRAETGLLLERLGQSPGDLDYLRWYRQQR